MERVQVHQDTGEEKQCMKPEKMKSVEVLLGSRSLLQFRSQLLSVTEALPAPVDMVTKRFCCKQFRLLSGRVGRVKETP